MPDVIIASHPGTVTWTLAERIEEEREVNLERIVVQLACIRNQETPLRLKLTPQGIGYVKTVPRAFLPRLLHGSRYEREAGIAKHYFGLAESVVIANAERKAKALTTVLLRPREKPFIDLRYPELETLHQQLAALDDDVVLQKDADDAVRAAGIDTSENYIDDAMGVFDLSESPTVAVVKSLVISRMHAIDAIVDDFRNLSTPATASITS